MDRIKALSQKLNDGNFSQSYPLGADAINIDLADGGTVEGAITALREKDTEIDQSITNLGQESDKKLQEAVSQLTAQNTALDQKLDSAVQDLESTITDNKTASDQADVAINKRIDLIDAQLVPFEGSSSASDGVQGLVPKPLIGQQYRFLQASGAWVDAPTGVKGDKEANYRTGEVNLTPAHIGAVPSSEKGQNNGVVPLNAEGLIDSKFLPSYVDDVLEFDTFDEFPPTGQKGIIYVDIATGQTYRWSGTIYTEISKNTNTTYELKKENSTIKLVGSDGSESNVVDNDTYYYPFTGAKQDTEGSNGLVPKPAAGQQGLFLRADATWAKPTDTQYGLFTKEANGLAPKLPTENGTTQFLRGDGSWAVPPDTKYDVVTTQKAGLAPTLSGTATTYLNGAGQYTTPPDTKYNVMGSASAEAAGASGLVPASKAGDQTKFLCADGTWKIPVNTTYGVVSTAANGLAPKLPATGGATVFLRGDGTWVAPPNTEYSLFSATTNGIVPKSPGGTTAFLRADGTWIAPPDTKYGAITTEEINAICV